MKTLDETLTIFASSYSHTWDWSVLEDWESGEDLDPIETPDTLVLITDIYELDDYDYVLTFLKNYYFPTK